MKKTLIALTIAGLSLAGCSGSQIKGLNGISTKPYSGQIEGLNELNLKDSSTDSYTLPYVEGLKNIKIF